MTEALVTATPEQLSNRRLVYETFVTAMRRVSVGRSDAHRVRGHTPEAGQFNVNDFFYFQLRAGEIEDIREAPRVRDEVLASRRPLIVIDRQDADADGYVYSYAMAYPEDLKPNGFINGIVQELTPQGWPPNEPILYQAGVRNVDGVRYPAGYRLIEEPFSMPDLASIYNAVAAGL